MDMSQNNIIVSYGRKHQPASYRFETEDYVHFQAIVVHEGMLHFTAANTRQALGRESVAVLRIGSAFRLWTASETGYRGVFVSLMNPKEPDFAGPSHAGRADEKLLALASCIEAEAQTPGPHSGAVLHHAALALAWLAVRPGATARRTGADPAGYWTERARRALDASLYAGGDVKAVLAPLGMSYRQLSRYFTRVAGMSPKTYQIRARIDEAKRLLTNTDLPITAIAYELGYPSSQHFAGQFKRVAGTTPSAWRAEFQSST